MINCCNSQKIPLWGLKNTSNIIVFSTLPTHPTRIVHLVPTKGLTASHEPELHWQLTLTRRRSPPKIIFQNSLWLMYLICRICYVRWINLIWWSWFLVIHDTLSGVIMCWHYQVLSDFVELKVFQSETWLSPQIWVTEIDTLGLYIGANIYFFDYHFVFCFCSMLYQHMDY